MDHATTIRRNPDISICELYGKLREQKAYTRHPGSLYRVFVRSRIPAKGGIHQEEVQAYGKVRYADRVG